MTVKCVQMLQGALSDVPLLGQVGQRMHSALSPNCICSHARFLCDHALDPNKTLLVSNQSWLFTAWESRCSCFPFSGRMVLVEEHHNLSWLHAAGLLTGIQARAQRPEYGRLLSDCEILYCDARLQLVSGVTHDTILHMTSQSLPALARDGWTYIMQVPPL